MAKSVPQEKVVVPRKRHPKRYYIATNGRVTVWREATKPLRSVVMREFSEKWRAARPSGEPHCYPAIPITKTHYLDLIAASLTVGTYRSALANRALPDCIRPLINGAGQYESQESAETVG